MKMWLMSWKSKLENKTKKNLKLNQTCKNHYENYQVSKVDSTAQPSRQKN